MFLEIQPTVFRFSGEVWLVVHSREFLCPGGDVIESEDSGKQLVVRATMVLSEARGLSLFLVIRGGIACNG